MAQSYFYKDVLPFSAILALAAECTNAVLKILFKAAALKGLSNYVFNAYSYTVSTLVLLPVVFIFSRRSELPTLKLPLLYRIFLLGVIGVASQICGYKGIEYSSPTLASAIGNLTPAFTFILAVVFRMENVALISSSAQAKITGAVVSISGALVVVLYDVPTIILASSRLLGSSQTNWVLGGLLLAVEYLLCSIWYIIQGVALYFITVVHTWGLHLKGPAYISIFRPLSIAIAAAICSLVKLSILGVLLEQY